MSDIEARFDELFSIVEEANKAILDVYELDDLGISIKEDETPVTEADLSAHHILVNGLTKLFPHIPIISEEGDQEYNRRMIGSESFWLIDPLDGTKEFIKRTGEFTVCVALIESAEPTFGLVSAPAMHSIYYGSPEYGSFKRTAGNYEPEPIHVSSQNLGIVLASRSYLNPATQNYIDQYFMGSTVVRVGSQLKLPRIAEGRADAYPRIDGPLHLWDLAAGHAILEGAGGSVTRPDGSPVTYDDSSLMVGDFVARSTLAK